MKKIHIVGLILIASAIGIIVSMSADYTQYQTFSSAKGESNKSFQIVGQLVKDKEMVYDAEKNANYFSFYVQDKKGDVCKVIFNGTKPQDFERSEQIVLTGKMNGDEFKCSHILMKCPSKYKNDKLDSGEYEETEFKAES
jgi:cytochrome c-type biogenesis protein CcmE